MEKTQAQTNDKVREVMVHPVTKQRETTYEGWSWPGFFFGAIWLGMKGLWKHAIAYFVISLFTLGIGGIFYSVAVGGMGNNWHYKRLTHEGYIPLPEYEKRQEEEDE